MRREQEAEEFAAAAVIARICMIAGASKLDPNQVDPPVTGDVIVTSRVKGSVLLFILAVVTALAPSAIEAQSEGGDDAAGRQLVADAEAFMAAYGDDLRRGDRASLSRRYDPAGTRELRPGQARHSSQEAIADRYAGEWRPPADFEWRDLTYEVVGPDRVLVSGLFAWTPRAGGSATVQSYAALLRRQPSGDMVIGLEAEAGLPPIPWLLMGIAAVVLALVATVLGWLAGTRRNRASRQPQASAEGVA